MTLPLPLSWNALYRRAPNSPALYLNDKGDTYKQLVKRVVERVMARESRPLTRSNVRVRAWIFWPDCSQRRDVGNREKLLMDAMSGVVWADDCQVFFQPEPPHRYDEASPRIELAISEHDGADDAPSFAGFTDPECDRYVRLEKDDAIRRKANGAASGRRTREMKRVLAARETMSAELVMHVLALTKKQKPLAQKLLETGYPFPPDLEKALRERAARHALKAGAKPRRR